MYLCCLIFFLFQVRPTAVNIMSDNMPLSAGRHHEMNCEVLGSDPPPKVEWWLGDVELSDYTQKVISSKIIYTCANITAAAFI